MAQCPQCQATLEDDFGMVNCHSCGALVMLDGEPAAPSKPELEPLKPVEPTFAPALDPEPSSVPVESAQDFIPAENTPVVEFEPSEVAPDVSPLNSQTGSDTIFPAPFPENQPDLSVPSNGTGMVMEPSEVASALLYDLKVAGIETLKIRNQFLEIFGDTRFGLTKSDVDRSIKEGAITFKRFNPVKAFALIEKMRSLPLDIVWEQHRYTAEESN